MRFRPNRHLNEELRKQPEFRKSLRGQAERAKRFAETVSPRGGTHRGYSGRFTVTEEGDEVRLGNTDIAAHLVEFGSVNNPPYAPLRRGVRAAGLRLDEQ